MAKIKIFGATKSLVQTKDRWYNIAVYLRELPPWAKERLHRAGLRIAQLKATDAFADIQTSLNNAGLSRWQRRETTAAVLRGVSYGGAPRKPTRTPAPEAIVRAQIAAAQAIVARYK